VAHHKTPLLAIKTGNAARWILLKGGDVMSRITSLNTDHYLKRGVKIHPS
jgi:hypothetical protein